MIIWTNTQTHTHTHNTDTAKCFTPATVVGVNNYSNIKQNSTVIQIQIFLKLKQSDAP